MPLDLLHYAGVLPLLGGLAIAASLVARAVDSPRWATLATAGLFLVVAGYPLYLAAFVAPDYSLAEAASNVAEGLPLYLRVAAAWSGGGGSLYLYAASIAAAGLILSRAAGSRDSLAPLAALVLVVLASSTLQGAFKAVEGVGGFSLNPLLESVWAALHPPATILGYSLLLSSSIVAVAGGWRPLVRSVFLVGWGLLGLGMLLGAYWSYTTLGWGGYWAWDPVEVAQLCSWLLATAALHLAGPLTPLRRGVLLLLASSLMLGPYVTRTGLSPLHGFASPGAGALPLLAASIVLLVAALYTLARALVESGVASQLSRALERLDPHILPLATAGLSLLAMAAILYGSLLVPSVMAALGLETGFPSMAEGVRFYHPILYPLALLALLASASYAVAARRGGEAMALSASGLAVAAALLYLLAWSGSITPLQGAPPATNAMAAAAALLAVASIVSAVVAPGFGAWWRLAHAGAAVALIGVLASGTYAFNSSYFEEAVVVPGEEVTVAGVTVRIVDYQYLPVKGSVDLAGHLSGESYTAYAAWSGLAMLSQDLAPALRDLIEAEALLNGGDGASEAILGLLTLGSIPLGTVELEFEAYTELVDLAGGGSRGLGIHVIALTLEEAQLILDASLEPGPAGSASASLEAWLKAERAMLAGAPAPRPGEALRLAPLEPIILEAGDVSLRIYSLLLAAAEATPSSGAALLRDAAALVEAAEAEAWGYALTIPSEVHPGIYVKALLEKGEAPIIRDLLDLGLHELITGSGVLEAALGSEPGTPALPRLAPRGLDLVVVLEVSHEGGDARLYSATIKFRVNGEASGIHGLVNPVVIVDEGLSDIYIAVYPPTAKGYYTEYHDPLIKYVAHTLKTMQPSQALALTALLAAGYTQPRPQTPEELAILVEQATVDLLVQAAKHGDTDLLGTQGVRIEAKRVPLVDLVWIGGTLTATAGIIEGLQAVVTTLRVGSWRKTSETYSNRSTE